MTEASATNVLIYALVAVAIVLSPSRVYVGLKHHAAQHPRVQVRTIQQIETTSGSINLLRELHDSEITNPALQEDALTRKSMTNRGREESVDVIPSSLHSPEPMDISKTPYGAELPIFVVDDDDAGIGLVPLSSWEQNAKAIRPSAKDTAYSPLDGEYDGGEGEKQPDDDDDKRSSMRQSGDYAALEINDIDDRQPVDRSHRLPEPAALL